MDLADRIRELAARIPKQLEYIQTEEATKNALILPFIAALGYDVFNPAEVTPELVADIGIKKGEKVDYAILKEGKPIILFECKHKDANLAKEHASQLHRYFHATDARFAVLTNGIQYRFYTDLDSPNKMDALPFLEVNLLSLRDGDLDELRKFSKHYFDVDSIVSTASELKYTREIKRLLGDEFKTPSPDFVRLFATQLYQGRLTQSVMDKFSEYVVKAAKGFISDQVNERLQSALNVEPQKVQDSREMLEPEALSESKENEISTTIEEIEAFFIVKAILRPVIDPSRVFMRDVQSYCGILLDDNNRKPVCRLRFGSRLLVIGLFDNPKKEEERVAIESLDDLYKYSDRLQATALGYDQKS